MRTWGVAALVAASLIAAPVASAEPARNFTIAPGSLSATWTATGQGIGFTQDVVDAVGCDGLLVGCDDTLLKVELPGTLSVATTNAAPTLPEAAIKIYKSDAEGNVGESDIAEGDSGTVAANESTAGEVEAGYYVVRIEFLFGSGSIDGNATLEPALLPTTTIAAPKGRKVRSFSGTAEQAGEARVTLVEYALLKVKGDSCTQIDARGRFAAAESCDAPTSWIKAKGTTRWSAKLRKALAKGSYALFARATDESNAVGIASRRNFRVR